MSTTYHNIRGKFKHVTVYEPEVFKGKRQWSLAFSPDQSEMDKFRKLGLTMKPHQDTYEDREYYVLRRDCEKIFGTEEVQFNPPAVFGLIDSRFVNKETRKPVGSYPKGNPPEDMEYIGNNTPIPHGSEGSVNISVYTHAEGKGCRLEGLYVAKLAEPWTPADRDDTDVDEVKPPEVEVSNPDEIVVLNDEAPW